MFALIKYRGTNSHYEVVPSSTITGDETGYSIKFRGCHYSVIVYFIHGDEVLVRELLFNIQCNLPYPLLDVYTPPVEPLQIHSSPAEPLQLPSSQTEWVQTSPFQDQEQTPSSSEVPVRISLPTCELSLPAEHLGISEGKATENDVPVNIFSLPQDRNVHLSAGCLVDKDVETEEIWLDNLDDRPFEEHCNFFLNATPDRTDFLPVDIQVEVEAKSKNRNKKHFCFYCGKLQAKISRHLVLIHKKEDDVKHLLTLDHHSNERKLILEKLRKLGDREHNKTRQDIITVGAAKIPNDTVICPNCNGYYSKKNLKLHSRRCNFSHLGLASISGRSKVLMAEVHSAANRLMREFIFPRIRRDDYFKLVTQDESLVLFGNINASTYLKSSQHHDKMIAQHLRLLCRIFITMSKETPSLKTMKEVVNAAHYDCFVNAVKTIAGYTEHSISHPTVINAACNVIRRFATFLRCLAIKHNNSAEIEIIDRFLYLLTNMQNLDLTKVALEKRTSIQRQRKIVIPTRYEINNLLSKIDKEITNAYVILIKKFDLEMWKQLTQMLLIYIMVFCRKRPGDIERLEVQEYDQINIMEGDFIKSMDEHKQNLANQLGRCVTRGKLNQNASLLILKKHIKAIQLLKKYRHEARVADNKYLWADPDKNPYDFFRAYNILTNFCKKNNLDFQKFSATKFRYHLASSTSRLDKIKQGVISKFMGHDEGIHQKIYQKQPIQSDVFTMGDILLTCNGFKHTEENEIQPITEVINSLSVSWLDSDEIEHADFTERAIKNTTLPVSTEIDNTALLEYIETENTALTESIEIENTTLTKCTELISTLSNGNNTSKSVSTSVCETANPSTSPLFENRPSSPSNINLNQRNSPNGCTTPTKRPSTASDQCTSEIYFTPIKRLTVSNSKKLTWLTPERKLTRELFKNFYQQNAVPSLEECIYTAGGKLSRTPGQIRTWIKRDLNRSSGEANTGGRGRWYTPQKNILRNIFRPYYEGRRALKYPPISEMKEAIRTNKELKKKTPSLIRSQLQHDYKYVRLNHSIS